MAAVLAKPRGAGGAQRCWKVPVPGAAAEEVPTSSAAAEEVPVPGAAADEVPVPGTAAEEVPSPVPLAMALDAQKECFMHA